jgi:hypothetical protein
VKESFFLAVRLAAERVRGLSQRGAVAVETEEVGESADRLYELMIAHDAAEAPPSALERETASIAPAETSAPSVATEPTPPVVPDTPPPSIAPPARTSTPAPERVLSELQRLAVPDSSQIPAGCVWPPMTGRAVCAAAHAARATLSVGRRSWAPSDAIELTTDRGLLLHTRAAWRWPSLDDARLALLAEIRTALPIRDALPEERTIALGADGDAWRMWIITPDLSTLADDVREAIARDASESSIIERCIEAWQALHAKLGARAAQLGPGSVARARNGWTLLAFGDGVGDVDRTPLRALKTLAQRFQEKGAWPALVEARP